ncbi:MAG: type II toxin-antitoxin system ParD family antitoxin [Alphaproteobacteria bacterium]|nr:type II toxin-antitoxin system ParD family antitoxin [Alphaproteobacteria bacterium]
MTTRQSISLTSPNDEWLRTQIASEEYGSKSEVVNDLIRKARKEQQEMEYIRSRLISAEQSGTVEQSRNEMLAEFKQRIRHDDV